MNKDMQQEKEGAPVIGIAWRRRTEHFLFRSFCRAIEDAGGQWILLDQVFSDYLNYDEEGNLTEGLEQSGALSEEVGRKLWEGGWQASNASEVINKVKNLKGIVFTGGTDISPSLYKWQDRRQKVEKEEEYFPERDVSDFLLMSYCLDHDLHILGACRGMQVLSVVSGADMIQDIPSYFQEIGCNYGYQHRPYYEDLETASHQDFVPNTVKLEKNSLICRLMKCDTLDGCPCWHHQAVKSVEDTCLRATGFTDTNGIPMIEVVERMDKTFAIGVQFHPEASIWKQYKKAENKDQYFDYDTGLLLFKGLCGGC